MIEVHGPIYGNNAIYGNNFSRFIHLDVKHVLKSIPELSPIVTSINKKYDINFFELRYVRYSRVDAIEVEISYKDTSILSMIIYDKNRYDKIMECYRREKSGSRKCLRRIIAPIALQMNKNADSCTIEYMNCKISELCCLLKEDPDRFVFLDDSRLPGLVDYLICDTVVEIDSEIDKYYENIYPKKNVKRLQQSYTDRGIAKESLILEQDDWPIWLWNNLLNLFGLKEAERIKVNDYRLDFYEIKKDIFAKEDPNKLDESIRRQIIIKTQDHEEEYRIANKIHEQLVGNPDYINNKIVLNMSDARLDDDTKNEVHLYIFNDSESDPEILI